MKSTTQTFRQTSSPRKQRRGWVSLFALLGYALLGTSTAVAQSRPAPARPVSAQRPSRLTIAPELAQLASRSGSSNQRFEVIVQFRQSPTNAHFQYLRSLGGVSRQSLGLVRGGVFNLPLSAIRALANRPDVLYISPNRTVAMSGADEYEATIGGDVAQSYGWDGTGVSVAVIDSGISDHPDLHDPMTGLSRVVYNESFVPGKDATDEYGHGTHVAGIIAGNSSASGGNGKANANSAVATLGVAPGV